MEGLFLAAVAVIVTFNSENVIRDCLEAVANVSLPAIVIDNASTDRTLEMIGNRPGVKVIANPQNRGFAAAVNQGIRATSAEFILILNPDAHLLTKVDGLILGSQQYGLAAGKLVDSEGRAQTGFAVRRLPTPVTLIFELFGINRLWPSNPINRRYRCLDRDLDQPGDVEQPAGAFLMTRRDVWERLGGFDESFHPIWFEDVDYCLRARNCGYRIEYVPAVVARHGGSHSIEPIPPGWRALYWCVSLLRYASKHFRFIGYRSICAAVVLSSVPRMVAGMIRERSLAPVHFYTKIIGIAGLCLVSPKRRGVGEVTNS